MTRLPVGILLAAGNSQRFGSNKLLHAINCTPMLMQSARTLVSALPDSIIVINQELISFSPQLEQLGMKVVVNTHASNGMGSSIACGVRASQDATSWLIALADMPYIKTETVTQLANRIKNGSAIVAPVFNQQRGHPVGFNQRFKNDLLALNDDVGARNIIVSHKNDLELVATDDSGVVRDIDQPGDVDA